MSETTPDNEQIAAAAADAAPTSDVLQLVATPSRLRLLYAIHAAPDTSVRALASAARMTPNAATQALREFLRAGLVSNTRRGRHSMWRLSDDSTHLLLHALGAPHSPLHPSH